MADGLTAPFHGRQPLCASPELPSGVNGPTATPSRAPRRDLHPKLVQTRLPASLSSGSSSTTTTTATTATATTATATTTAATTASPALPPPSPSSPARNRQRRPDPINMTLTGDRADDARQGRAGAWYSPRTRPASERTASADATPTRMPAPALASPGPRSPALSKPSSPARFSFFSSSVAALKGIKPPPPPADPAHDDELLGLDLDAALFPSGAPADGDAFSPAAYKNLHMNAAGLLRRFQAAYQRRAAAHQLLRAEREAEDEERSEMETRSRHLKMQLEDMAHKAAENEATMRALMDELNREKRLRAEERQARAKTSICSNTSTLSEDLAAEEDQRRRARRRSAATVKSDASSDTDGDSVEEASLFSRSRSPTLTVSTLDTTHLHHHHHHHHHNNNNNNPLDSMPPPPPPPTPPTQAPTQAKPVAPRAPPRQSPPQMSTIQKLFKGMSSAEAPKEDEPRGPASCRNCQGQDASVAWDTASLLRDENRGLKQRVGELEEAVEEALDAVNGIRL